MIRRSPGLLLSFLLALPALAPAQDDEGSLPNENADVVAIASWKCDANEIGTLMDETREKLIPIAQQSIDSGNWQYFQLLIHSWGDEWNVLFYTRAPSMDDYFAGWAQYIFAIETKYPEALEWFFDVCPEHRDNFYRSVVYAGVDAVESESDM